MSKLLVINGFSDDVFYEPFVLIGNFFWYFSLKHLLYWLRVTARDSFVKVDRTRRRDKIFVGIESYLKSLIHVFDHFEIFIFSLKFVFLGLEVSWKLLEFSKWMYFFLYNFSLEFGVKNSTFYLWDFIKMSFVFSETLIVENVIDTKVVDFAYLVAIDHYD